MGFPRRRSIVWALASSSSVERGSCRPGVAQSAHGEQVRSSRSDIDSFAYAFSLHRRVVSCSDQLTLLHTSYSRVPSVFLTVLFSFLPVLSLPVLVVIAPIRVQNTVVSEKEK